MAPTVHGIVQIISRCSSTDVQKFNTTSTGNHRTALVKYLHGVNEIQYPVRCILKEMELFPCTENMGITHFVSIQECGMIAPKHFPVKFPRPLLHLVTKADKFLATLLGCTTCNPGDIVKEILNMTCDSDHHKQGQTHTKRWSSWDIERVVLFALDNADICDSLTEYMCIPCRPNRQLRYPKDLVDPSSQLADLFNEEDNRFPIRDIACEGGGNKRLVTLRNLGMMHTSIPGHLIIQLAQRVEILACTNSKKAENKCVALLNYLGRENNWQNCQKLKDIPFMPTLAKPRSWPLCWHGESTVWAPPRSLFCPGLEYLVGSQCLVAGDLQLTLSNKRKQELFDNLGVTVRNEVPNESVLQQLMMISNLCYDEMEEQEKVIVGKMCSSIYQYIDQISAGDDFEASDFQKLVNQPILFLGEKFIHPRVTAFQKLKCDCTPELFCLEDRDSLSKYKNFLKIVGVKECFDPDDINNVLKRKKEKFGNKKLLQKEISLVINLVMSLATVVEESQTLPSEPIYMPDRTGSLHDVKDLCRDDCEFQVNKKNLRIVHNNIAHNTAELLGVKTLRHHHVKPHTRGLPFGQSEKLTNRLKRLLESYSCGTEIMKELLQNADDAGATKLCFIKDFQHHPCEKVFEDSWKPLQGPALCVFNNSSFTKSDLEGIQKLGEGSKQGDPTKTGQYGVGFNSVYHLTDAPSFLTKGEAVDSGEMLCVLDPHCRYVQGATVESPGKRYVDLEGLREDYPDVFGCYPDEIFGNESSGTLFRFPLRNEEMAETSKIRDKVVTECQVNELIEMFKDGMMESLLFLNNVTSIEVRNTCLSRTRIEQEYNVMAIMSEVSKMRKDNFFSHLKSVTQQIREKRLNICDIEREQELPKVVIEAIRNGDLGLLPRGGIALLLPELPRKQPETKGKAFCFLPLSQKTGLPVHVNGHFSLDQESRRHLKKDNSQSFRTLWNKTLSEHVIADCYVSGLQDLKSFLLPENHFVSKLSESQSRLQEYFDSFPNISNSEGEYWKNVTAAFYRQIDNDRIQLFPVIQNYQEDEQSGILTEWVALKAHDEHGFSPFLDSIKEDVHTIKSSGNGNWNDNEETKITSTVRQTLKTLGMKLMNLPMWLFHSMIYDAGVEVHRLQACHLRDFLKAGNQKHLLDQCRSLSVNVPLSLTVFRNTDLIKVMLQYCNLDDKLMENLDGLPLLVTQDGVLKVFKSDNPVFSSEFYHLIPTTNTDKLALFLHNDLLETQGSSGKITLAKAYVLFEGGDRHVFLRSMVSQSRNPKDVLGCLEQQKEKILMSQLSCDEALCILQFFNDNLDELCAHLSKVSVVKEQLKALPFYEDTWIHPMEYVRHRLQLTNTDKQSEIVGTLKNLKFIPGESRGLFKASEFFSPFDPVFEAMFQDEKFPPKPYCCEDWRTFMEHLGMKTQENITADMFLEFARQVEQEGELFGVTEGVERKSKALVKHLFSNENENFWSDPVLSTDIGEIQFIVPLTVRADYTDIHPQRVCDGKLLSFSSSVPKMFEKLTWTTQFVRKFQFGDNQSYLKSEHLQLLQNKYGIHVDPSIDSVLSHIQNVCDSLKTLFDKCDGQQKVDLDAISDLMGEIRACMMPACQVVPNLSEEQRIEPHLVKVPDCYWEYIGLFEHLGMKKKPTAHHFVRVLCALHEDTNGEELNPSELECMVTAVKNLFKLADINMEVDKLYLPSEDNKLVISTQLIFSDNTQYRKRLGCQDELAFFAGFHKLGINVHDSNTEIGKIPERHRPKMLTFITKECLFSQCEDVTQSDESKRLELFLHKPEFFNAALRLIKHQTYHEHRVDTSTVQTLGEDKIWSDLQAIRVVEVPEIETQLVVENLPPLPASRKKRKCFFETVIQMDVEKHMLYVRETVECEFTKWILTVMPELVHLLTKCIHQTLGESGTYLTYILTVCIQDPKEIEIYLDEENIQKYEGSFDVTDMLFPPLGEKVKKEFCSQLDDSFCEFSVGEHAALETFDRDIDEKSDDTEGLDPDCFIYAKVIRRIETDANFGIFEKMLQKYKLDIGKEVVEVISLRMFKFLREEMPLEMDAVDVVPKTQFDYAPDEIKREIREQLRECWSLPDDVRRSGYEQQPQPNPLESKRWMRQARCDLDAARSKMVATDGSHYNWVCYMCQQSAEKALKAAWYKQDSRKVSQNHHLPSVASGLGADLAEWAEKLQELIGHHTKMRYPDALHMPKIPSDMYTQPVAEEACEIAHRILDLISMEHN
ncbi:hypothetical protein ScPMuIL_018385 [Solemya velum]